VGATEDTSFFPPGDLERSTTYYWRVDSVNSGGTTRGDIWSFTTVSLPGLVKTWGGADWDSLWGVAVDSTANVYCGGCTRSFGAGEGDALLLKYDLSGTLQWARTWGGADDEMLWGIASDAGDNIYCAGDTLSFGEGDFDTLLLKYDTAGALQWSRTWGGSDEERIRAIATDESQNVYCAGDTRSFGEGSYDTLLLKYDASGALQWARTWGDWDRDLLEGVTVDSDGSIYCVGYSYDFGPGYYGALLLKYDAWGWLQWARNWGGGSADRLRGVAVASDGCVYCAGYTERSGTGDRDALMLKYSSSGELLHAETWGGNSWDGLVGVVVDSYGNIYYGGSSTSFSAGNSALLLKCDSSCRLHLAKVRSCEDYDYVADIAVDSTGNVYLGGCSGGSPGVWQAVTSGIGDTPSGIEGTPSGTVNLPAGVEGSPSGSEGSPTGSQTGAGSTDALLLKNWE
jgi:hypothetical protein